MKLKELAERWLADLSERVKLDDLKPASLATFVSRTNTHILPGLGELEIEAVRNGEVQKFATSLSSKLGPKTTREVVALVKSILESHVNKDGEPILDLKWNNKFIFKSTRKVGKQKQPTISREALNGILSSNIIARHRVLLILAAATGLRVGELQAVRINGDATCTSWDSEASTIQVRKSIWRGKEQEPKTPAAIRQIDLSQPVNKMLADFTDGRQVGEFIFTTKTGKPLDQKYIQRYIMRPNKIPGMHSFRRYRATWAEEQACPRFLLAAWLGHSTKGEGITSLYIKSENQAFRKTWCERVGTGLNIPVVGLPHATQFAPAPDLIPLVVSNLLEPEQMFEEISEPVPLVTIDDLEKARVEFLALGGKLEHSFSRS